MGHCCRAYCEKNTVVDFILSGHNIENMDVFIYYPENVESLHSSLSLIGIVTIRVEKIIFEVFPDDFELFKHYQIGMNCIKNVLNYPCSILG